MGHALNRVRNTVGEIVQWIHAPRIARAVVMGVANAVNHGVAHHDETGAHVNFCTQDMRAFREFARTHTTE